MLRRAILALALFLVPILAAPLCAQSATDPIPEPLGAGMDPILVGIQEFATLPDIDGIPARMMTLVDEPATQRLFVSDMRGPLYTVGYGGGAATLYLDTNDPRWNQRIQSQGRERGLQSFAIHPQFGQAGTPGYGKLYTWVDVEDTSRPTDFQPSGGDRTHHMALLEWTARNAAAPTYDGAAPRELFRVEDPFSNHNGGRAAFNTTLPPNHPDYGMLFIGVADGGSGGDPLGHAQNLGSLFGKLLRIDPLGTESANGKYGIPPANPFAGDDDPRTLGEIYAYGLRNPQRFAWDPANGNLFLADIGQNIVEEIDLVTAGANLGWNDWEGSYAFISRQEVSLANRRGDARVTYPIAEYGQIDPLLQNNSAVTMGYVYRGTAIPQLRNLLIFGDNPSGEIFYVNADTLPRGGQDSIRRILFTHEGMARTLLQLIREKNAAQGKTPATRADLRFGQGPDGQILVLNKRDGVIRMLVPDRK